MSKNHDQRELRETKKLIKRLGNKKKRRKFKSINLNSVEEDDFYDEDNYGQLSSEKYNGIFRKAKKEDNE